MKDETADLSKCQQWSRTSTEFLNALKCKEDSAWDRVLRRACWHVYAVARDHGLSLDVADDIIQNVLLEASNNIGKFNHNGHTGAFRKWLRMVVRAQLGANVRESVGRVDLPIGGSQVLKLLHDLPAGDVPTSTDTERQQFAESILQAVEAKLKPANWEAFCRVVFRKQPPDEVAAELGMSLNQVYLIKSRTMRRLAQALCDEDKLDE